MKTITALIGAFLLLATVLVAPAIAQDAPTRDRQHRAPAEAESEPIPAPSDAVPAPAPADAAPVDTVPAPIPVPTDRPLRDTPTDRPDEPRPDPEPEALRLNCNGRVSNTGRAAIVCEWSGAESERATGYVLERATENHDPIVIAALRGLDIVSHIDADVRFDTPYGYRVKALSEAGHVVGISDWDRAIVETPAIDVEVLSLDCDGRIITTADGRQKVAHCEWRPATNPDAVGYQLWRIVGDEYREMVWSGGLDVTSHTSRLPGDTAHALYAVLALDADGNIVGRSRPDVVRFTPLDVRVLDRQVRAQ